MSQRIEATAPAGTPEQPAAKAGALTAALTATVGVLQVTDVIDGDTAGAVNLALAAWVACAFLWVSTRVTAARRQP